MNTTTTLNFWNRIHHRNHDPPQEPENMMGVFPAYSLVPICWFSTNNRDCPNPAKNQVQGDRGRLWGRENLRGACMCEAVGWFLYLGEHHPCIDHKGYTWFSRVYLLTQTSETQSRCRQPYGHLMSTSFFTQLVPGHILLGIAMWKMGHMQIMKYHCIISYALYYHVFPQICLSKINITESGKY